MCYILMYIFLPHSGIIIIYLCYLQLTYACCIDMQCKGARVSSKKARHVTPTINLPSEDQTLVKAFAQGKRTADPCLDELDQL